MITEALSFPLKTIHKNTEIVDAYGELVLIAADGSVNMIAICEALNNQANKELSNAN